MICSAVKSSSTTSVLRPFGKKFIRSSLSTSNVAVIDAAGIIIEKTNNPKEKLPKEELLFGKSFSDHLVQIDWTSAKNSWSKPLISEYKYFNISPAASCLHYGIQCFEGMKAYKDSKGKIRFKAAAQTMLYNFT